MSAVFFAYGYKTKRSSVPFLIRVRLVSEEMVWAFNLHEYNFKVELYSFLVILIIRYWNSNVKHWVFSVRVGAEIQQATFFGVGYKLSGTWYIWQKIEKYPFGKNKRTKQYNQVSGTGCECANVNWAKSSVIKLSIQLIKIPNLKRFPLHNCGRQIRASFDTRMCTSSTYIVFYILSHKMQGFFYEDASDPNKNDRN